MRYQEKESPLYTIMYGGAVVALVGFIGTVLLYKDISALAKGGQANQLVKAESPSLRSNAVTAPVLQQASSIQLPSVQAPSVQAALFQPSFADRNHQEKLREIEREADYEAASISHAYTAQLQAQIQNQIIQAQQLEVGQEGST